METLPQNKSVKTKEQKILDSLAFVLNGGGICSAVIFDDNNERLYITTNDPSQYNDKEIEHISDVLSCLSEENPSQESQDKLVKIVLEKHFCNPRDKSNSTEGNEQYLYSKMIVDLSNDGDFLAEQLRECFSAPDENENEDRLLHADTTDKTNKEKLISKLKKLINGEYQCGDAKMRLQYMIMRNKINSTDEEMNSKLARLGIVKIKRNKTSCALTSYMGFVIAATVHSKRLIKFLGDSEEKLRNAILAKNLTVLVSNQDKKKEQDYDDEEAKHSGSEGEGSKHSDSEGERSMKTAEFATVFPDTKSNQYSHAEVLLVMEFVRQMKISYVGVSKYCCPMCATILSSLGVKFAGMHNKCSNVYVLPKLSADDNVEVIEKSDGQVEEKLNKYLNDFCEENQYQAITSIDVGPVLGGTGGWEKYFAQQKMAPDVEITICNNDIKIGYTTIESTNKFFNQGDHIDCNVDLRQKGVIEVLKDLEGGHKASCLRYYQLREELQGMKF